MAVRTKASVVVTYDRCPSTPTFLRTPPSPNKPPSVDSGIGLDETAYPAEKLQGVVVTVPRRRFVRSKESAIRAPASKSSEQLRTATAYRDFVLYPTNSDSMRGHPTTGPPTPALKPSDHRTEQRPSRSDSTHSDGRTSTPRHTPGSNGLLQPSKPMPPRLPTPDIPEVDESSWWGK